MHKHLATLFVLSILLTACSTPNPDMSDLNGTTAESDNYALSDTEINSSDSSINNQGNTMNTTDKAVKNSVEDFEKIAATSATIKTTKGDITIQLYREETPVTTANFLDLASKGFYDGIVFHRVIPDFMAQVGDPLTKDATTQAMWGSGGPGYTIIDEFSQNLKHDSPGVLSMANTGRPSTGGSQFFMTFEPTPWLDGKHTVFGKITQGLDVLMSIEQGDTIVSISYQ